MGTNFTPHTTADQSPVKLTLDTNLLHEYWKDRPKASVVKRLIELAAQGTADLAVTARVHEDVPSDPLFSKLRELSSLGIEQIGSVTRLDHWVLDRDVLGSDSFVAWTIQQAELARAKGVKPPDWRDWDHLHAHLLQGRDLFLTWDKGILELASELRTKFGIVVLSPEKALDEIQKINTST